VNGLGILGGRDSFGLKLKEFGGFMRKNINATRGFEDRHTISIPSMRGNWSQLRTAMLTGT
jgi:hypothetical protein